VNSRFGLRLGGPFVLLLLAPALTLPGSLGLAGSLLLPFIAFTVQLFIVEYRARVCLVSRHQQNLAGSLTAFQPAVGLPPPPPEAG
jgi:hypothetical protein